MSCDRSSHRRCSVKKRVLRNFAKFTGKHLCQRVSILHFVPRFLRACVNISNLTCQDSLLIKWLLIKRRVYTKYLPLFPLLRGMPNAFVSFTVTSSNNSTTKKWKWFSSLFYLPLPLFCPVPSLIQTTPQKYLPTLQNLLQKSIRHCNWL